METPKMVFVTGNDHKRWEVREILGVELEGADPDVPELQAVDPAEVAAAKALAAHRALGSPGAYVLAEDSGIMVEAWNGFPGALTKWLMGSVGNEGLLKMLSGFEDRSARSVCVAAVATPDGGVETFRGEVRGTVAPEAAGSGTTPCSFRSGPRSRTRSWGRRKTGTPTGRGRSGLYGGG